MASDLFAELVTPNGIRYQQPLGLFIDNKFVPSKSDSRISTIDPATEKVITKVHAASAENVNDAVLAARRAFEGPWGDKTGAERGRLLNTFADVVERNGKILAAIESWDNEIIQGKPYSSSISEDIPEFLDVLRYYAGWADKNHGQEPIGVCAQIIPWNYPIVMLSWKLAPAIAAGNCIILKVSEQTPLSALYLARLVEAAGFPPGVINIINGYGPEAGSALAAHIDVDKVAFTGSTQTGREIMKLASSNLKSVTLETGGKSPLVVFSDANLHAAAATGYQGIMGNAGQNCSANSKILVQEDIFDRFLKLFKARAISESKIGSPFENETIQGPQITKGQFDRILSYVQSGRDEGATLVHGGTAYKDLNGKGFYIEPTIFTDVTPQMRIYKEEIFGPFVVILAFKTETEAVRLANDTEYGLAAAVFTKDITRALRLTRKINAGSKYYEKPKRLEAPTTYRKLAVWINNSQIMDPRVPFGGFKQSGIGREQGEAGFKAYTKYKTVIVDLALDPVNAHTEAKL
ncbi:hypothetical protein H9L39_20282 [Fusarium oxysporum f. sp. albedinis]|nr:hypothetical protein H9L39_20282 [Fusarium oxysporum f. sp. albedinis]